MLRRVMMAAGGISPSWKPSDEATLRHWYTADYSGNTYEAGACSVIVDQAGAPISLNQTTPAKRPTVNASALNGRDVLSFDGGDLLTSNVSSSTFRDTTAGMILTVHRVDAAQAQSRSVIALVAATAARAVVFSATAANVSIATAAGRRLDANSFQFGGSTGATNSPAAELFAVEFDWGNAKLRQYSNGTLGNTTDPFQSAGSTSNTIIVDTTLGAVKSGTTENQFHLGDIAEVLVFQTWSTDLRQKAEGYLAHEWGLAGDLPIGHPYKDAPPLA